MRNEARMMALKGTPVKRSEPHKDPREEAFLLHWGTPMRKRGLKVE